MSVLLVLLIVMFVIVTLGITQFFLGRNKRIRRQHLDQLGQLQLSFEMHKKQLDARQNQLSVYNFLTYNLEEALLVQPKIKLK